MRLIVLVACLALVPAAGVAQPSGKIYRVGVIGLSPISAQTLGLTSPPSVLGRADQLIE